jgi:hypothetical protein
VVHDEVQLSMDCRTKSGNDEDGASFRDKRVDNPVRKKSGNGIQARRLFPDFTEPVIGPATLGRTRWFNRGYVCSSTILPMSLLDWFEL